MPFAAHATFDSSSTEDDSDCLPNTRVDVLQQIRTWADGDDERYIFWLCGWAGTGKSTIARTVAREYASKGRLGASFFFSRGKGDVHDASMFVTSIAVQLAQSSKALRDLIYEAILSKPGIVSKTLRDQWQKLILEPLSKLEAGLVPKPVVIVIDALDECDGENDIQQVVQLLADAQVLRTVRFRVFITSRPEIPIRHGFSEISDAHHRDFVLQDISKSIVEHDIHVFLETKFKTIRQKWGINPNWPSEHDIRRLVLSAGGLFIWAATACRFIWQGRQLAARRLSILLQSGSSINKPEEQLNKIYTTVLKNSVGHDYEDQEREDLSQMLRQILGSIVILFSSLSTISLARLLDTHEEEVDQTLVDLHSILDIPKDPSCPIRLHHPSFRDFLLDEKRCSDTHFLVDEKKAQGVLADRCIRLMADPKNGLRRDICGLHAPGALAREVHGNLMERRLPPELQYACRYWVQHLQRSEFQLCDDGQVHLFLRQHLLHWLELLSLIGKTSEGVHAIILLESMVRANVVKRTQGVRLT